MNSRELVRRAIEFEKPERLPFWQHVFDDIPDDVCDCWEMDRGRNGWFFDNPVTDDWGCGWEKTEQKNMGQVVHHPLADWAALDTYVPPDPKDPFYFDRLEDELRAASSTELAQVAIKEGNAQRGKKLFYQSAAACFACHDPPRGAVRLGPDLAKITTKLSVEQLVESILHPSKLIDKEYAQVSVQTSSGQVQTGVRISESEKEIVLRNLAQLEPIKIDQDDIVALLLECRDTQITIGRRRDRVLKLVKKVG